MKKYIKSNVDFENIIYITLYPNRFPVVVMYTI